ncbi:MAG TPA: hypothetical protein VMZ06_03220 [Candidatus Bathyarchaeia archaeon]|nr:hypothetical protein [Candidatus Bathyarchaeia archaeon]
MAKRIAVVLGIVVLAGAVLFYVLWNGPGGDETAPKRPDRRNLTKLLEKSAAPPAGKEQEKVPPDLLDRATRAATRPAPAAATQPNYIKSSDIPEDNGMHWFLLAAELMPEFDWELGEREDNMFEFGWQDDSRISDQIEKYREAFDAVRKGLEVGNALLPLEPEKSVPGAGGEWRELTQLMTLDAMREASRGNVDAALEIYDVLLNFSAESCRGGFQVYHLAAGARQRVAAQQLCKTLQAPGVSAEQYRVTMERLAALDARAPTLADAMAVEAAASEYWHNKEANPDRIRDVMRSAAKDWDEAGKQFVENASTSDLVELSRQCVEVLKQAVPLFEAEMYEFDYAAYQKLIDSNRLSKNMGDAQRRFLGYSLTRAQRRGTMLVAAIEAYRRNKGTYPASLDAVATALAVELPKDPFTGAPFGYVQQGAGYLLYSAGINMLDDGGKGKPWDPKQDDYLIVRRE